MDRVGPYTSSGYLADNFSALIAEMFEANNTNVAYMNNQICYLKPWVKITLRSLEGSQKFRVKIVGMQTIKDVPHLEIDYHESFLQKDHERDPKDRYNKCVTTANFIPLTKVENIIPDENV